MASIQLATPISGPILQRKSSQVHPNPGPRDTHVTCSGQCLTLCVIGRDLPVYFVFTFSSPDSQNVMPSSTAGNVGQTIRDIWPEDAYNKSDLKE